MTSTASNSSKPRQPSGARLGKRLDSRARAARVAPVEKTPPQPSECAVCDSGGNLNLRSIVDPAPPRRSALAQWHSVLSVPQSPKPLSPDPGQGRHMAATAQANAPGSPGHSLAFGSLRYWRCRRSAVCAIPGPQRASNWRHGADSNRRPVGYEPTELPLLHRDIGAVELHDSIPDYPTGFATISAPSWT